MIAPAVASGWNLRDVGGYVTRGGGAVRTGLLYRSGDLSRLDGQDAATLGGLGLRVVYDLRSAVERARQPDHLPPGAVLVALDILAGSAVIRPEQMIRALDEPRTAERFLGGGRGARWFAQQYREFVTEAGALVVLGRLYRDLADPARRPALIHCATGKDRTGWAVAALLLLLDVPEPVVMTDYLASGVQLAPAFQPMLDQFSAAGGDPDLLRPLMDVRPEYLEAGLDEMRRRYATIEGYFARGLGIDRATQEALRAAFVAVAPVTSPGPGSGTPRHPRGGGAAH
ncbi:MAG: tyrosine-protein phosphatase [Candidatus Limnocylindrales bacterium]